MQHISKILKFCHRYLLGVALIAGTLPAHAEHINGFKTWTGDDRATVGMLHFDASSSNRYGWTTNGRTFDCVGTTNDLANYHREIYCPSINYTFNLYRTYLTLRSSGGTVTYAGHWDDRRFFYYKSNTGRFALKDGFVWEETQYANGNVAATFKFKETQRDDNFIYMYDSSRNVSVAISKTKVFVKIASGPWTEYYTGSW